eukprot:g3155.t1
MVQISCCLDNPAFLKTDKIKSGILQTPKQCKDGSWGYHIETVGNLRSVSTLEFYSTMSLANGRARSMSSGGAAKPSQPQVSIAQLGVPVAEQSQPQVSIPQLGVSVAEQSQPQSSIAQLGVSVAKQSQPQVSIPQLGVSVAFLLEFTEKHQKSGKLLPTDSVNSSRNA